MNDKPDYYFSDPKFQEFVSLRCIELSTLLDQWRAAIQAAGGDSNEQISALSHWTALLIAEGAHRLACRAEEMTGDAVTREQHFTLLRAFLNDATARAITASRTQVH